MASLSVAVSGALSSLRQLRSCITQHEPGQQHEGIVASIDQLVGQLDEAFDPARGPRAHVQRRDAPKRSFAQIQKALAHQRRQRRLAELLLKEATSEAANSRENDEMLDAAVNAVFDVTERSRDAASSEQDPVSGFLTADVDKHNVKSEAIGQGVGAITEKCSKRTQNDMEFKVDEDHLWLLKKTQIEVVDRLRVVKAAWILGGGPSPQSWFKQNGSKKALLSGIFEALSQFAAQSVYIPAGFQEAVLAKDFNFNACMQKFDLNWESVKQTIYKCGAASKREPTSSSVVKEMDNICAVQSDKASVELTSSYSGKIGKIHHKAGPPDATATRDHDTVNSQADNTGGTPDAASNDVGVVSEVFGPAPLVRLFEERLPCPRGILPKGATFLAHREACPPVQASTSQDIVAEALSSGYSCAAAPEFLGVVPKGLIPKMRKDAEPALPTWRTLLIVGPSGSGKTSLLRSINSIIQPSTESESFYPTAVWSPGTAIIEHFDGGFEQAQNWLCGVGLCSVPSWCKPFSALSLGEQYRANVARALAAADASVPLVFDEWTSELDRGVACAVCVALRRRLAARHAAGQKDPILLLATCHDDVETHLQPDILIRCCAGSPPEVVYDVTSPGTATWCTPQLQAVFKGVVEPVPPGDTMSGRWCVQVEGGSTQEFVIGKASQGHLRFAIAGAGNSGTTSLKREDETTTTWDDAQRVGVWYYAKLRSLGLNVRVQLVVGGQLIAQFRMEPEGLAELTEHVKKCRSLKLTHLAAISGEGKFRSEKSRTYHTRLLMRQAAIAKVWDLTAAEESASKCYPAERTPQQTSTVLQMFERFDLHLKAKEEELTALTESSAEWSGDAQGTRMPSFSSTFTKWLSSASRSSDSEEHVSHDQSETRSWLRRAGWYVPPDDDVLYPGLKPTSIKNCAPAFQANPRNEIQTPGLIHLASYVGEGASYLSPALEQAARLLDSGFDGLCVHAVSGMNATADLSHLTIGIVIGPSGSGKTSLAKERFGEPLAVLWNEESPALAHFSSLNTAEAALSAVALDLEKAMRPVKLLSGGERERLALAWGLTKWAEGRLEIFVIDEFTSLLDREIAKQVAHGIHVFARSQHHTKAGKGLVFVTSHKDIVGKGKLEPDWVFECDSLRLLMFDKDATEAAKDPVPKRRRLSAKSSDTSFDSLPDCKSVPKRRRISAKLPEGSCDRLLHPNGSKLIVRRALPCEWRHFREHHYKDHRLMGGASCFVGEVDGRAVAFTAIVHTGFPVHWILARQKCSPESLGYSEDTSRQVLREHRTVVFPDSQGLGLGSLMADAVAAICARMGYAFMSVTAHPTYGGYRDRSPFWITLPSSQRERQGGACSTFSHLWLGACNGSPHEEALRHRVSIEGATLTKAIASNQH